MSAVDLAIREYVAASEGDSNIRAGGKARTEPPGAADLLLKRLDREGHLNNLLLKVAVACLVAVFLLAVAYITSNWSSPKASQWILGGTNVGLVGVAAWIVKLWERKVEIDMLVTILPSLSPEARLKAVLQLFHARRSRSPSPKN